MCCERCIVEVKRIFKNAGVPPLTVHLGEVVVNKTVSPNAQKKIIKNLEEKGFSLVFSEDEKLVVNIQALLVFYLREYILKKEKLYKISNFLSKQLNRSYTQLMRGLTLMESQNLNNKIIRFIKVCWGKRQVVCKATNKREFQQRRS